MITDDGKLQVFESFIIDHNLPKHRREEEGESRMKSRSSGLIL